MTGPMVARRLIALAFCTALAAGALVACGGDDDKLSEGELPPSKITEEAGDEPVAEDEPAAEAFDLAAFEKKLAKTLGGDKGDDAVVTEASCPSNTADFVKPGEGVECNLGGYLKDGTAQVTFEDESGTAFSYTAEIELDDGATQTLKGNVTGE